MTGQATNKREGAIVFLEWLVELGTDHAETIFDDHFPELDNDEWWEMVKASIEEAGVIVAKAKEKSK